MNSLQRAWRSAIRKPIKSILLLLVMVTVCLFLLCGMACRNANVQTQDTARAAIGVGFRLDGNEKNRTKRLMDLSEKIGAGKEGSYGGVHQKKLETAYGTQWMVWCDNSFDSLLIADIEKIAAVPGISDYNISTCITAVNPVGFDRIEDPDVDQSSDMGGVVLIGNRKMDLDFNVLSGNVTIKDGRMVTETDQDVCVISEQLARQDQLFIEAFITALVAFAISFTLAPAASGVAADYLVSSQAEQAELEKNMDADKVASGSESSEQRVVGVDAGITKEMFLICTAGMTILTAVSIGTAGIGILKKNPKDILSELV